MKNRFLADIYYTDVWFKLSVIMNQLFQYSSMTRNTKERRGSKVVINVPSRLLVFCYLLFLDGFMAFSFSFTLKRHCMMMMMMMMMMVMMMMMIGGGSGTSTSGYLSTDAKWNWNFFFFFFFVEGGKLKKPEKNLRSKGENQQ